MAKGQMAMSEAQNAFKTNWMAAARGTFLWSLCIWLYLLLFCGAGGLIIFESTYNDFQEDLLLDAIVILGALSAIGPFSAGYVRFIVEIMTSERCEYSLLLSGFNDFGKTFLIGFYSWGISVLSLSLYLGCVMVLHLMLPTIADNLFFRIILVGLGSLLLISVQLRLTWIPFYVYLDEGYSLSAWNIVRVSWHLVNNNEWSLFTLLLKFIGWNLLAIMSCGIGWLWVCPYTVGSIYYFYKELKEKQSKGIRNIAYENGDNLLIDWSSERIFTVSFIVIFWTFFLCLAFS